MVGVLINWVAVIQRITAKVTTKVVAEVIIEVITEVIIVWRAVGVIGAAGVAIKVASSAAIRITGGWVNQQYSKSPTSTLLDSSKLYILGGLIAIG